MKQTLESRELIELDGIGATVRGTYHKVPDQAAEHKTDGPQQPRVGVVFLNSLSATRAASGDSAVYWANAFADCGYPSFRLDFSGFGDSIGDPPAELLRFIHGGGYASTASIKIEELVERFHLDEVILVGLCAGAVSAIYTAAVSKECKGLILLDPYFHLPLVQSSILWQKLTGRASRSAPGRLATKTYEQLKALCVAVFRNGLPSNANFTLLNSWKKVAAEGLPILIFKASARRAKGVDFDYHKYILELAGRRSQVTVRVIEGAGHTFSNRSGRSAVACHTESWLRACFPLKTVRKTEANTLLPGRLGNEGNHGQCEQQHPQYELSLGKSIGQNV